MDKSGNDIKSKEMAQAKYQNIKIWSMFTDHGMHSSILQDYCRRYSWEDNIKSYHGKYRMIG